uniref:Uncharacterized protein n=1 Tax=Acrobeloides nanus TaxID=290746 RepID=A0A914CYC3_9BILA
MNVLIKRYKGLLIHVNNEKPEIKLFIIALIMFVYEFIIGIIFAGEYITIPGSNIRTILLAIQPFVADLAALSPSWMLFISSRRIREALFGKYFARSNQTITVTPVHVISSSLREF